jgi:iron complex transport system permease protein
MKKRPFLINTILLLLALVTSIAVGSVFIPPARLAGLLLELIPGLHLPTGWTSPTAAESVILFQIRLPRTFLIALVGAALGGSGAAYQGLFRNPLADPYLIGVASGAGLGAVLAMSVKFPYTLLGMLAVPASAFIAAILTVALVYSLARVGRTVPTTNLILAGVALSSFTTAISSYLMLRSQGELRRAISWLMGGGTLSGWQPVLAVLPYVILGLGILMLMGNALNVMQFGDEQAQQLGIPVEKVRRWVVVAASMTTAAAVAFAGIIGFVGLVIPHVVRLLFTGDYRRLLPLSVLAGAALLLFADVLARVVIAPQELPVGVITALAGAPFFLWVLRRAKSQAFW